MINALDRCRTTGTPLLCLLMTMTSPAMAQDLGPSSLFRLGVSILSEGEELLNNAPGMLDDFLESAETGQSFDTHETCLGALQVAVNAGAVTANVLPFSSVHIFEDARGPVGRFRMLMNGTKLHLEAFCLDKDLSMTMLPWGEGTAEPTLVSKSSFDATVGLLLLLEAQGAFEEDGAPDSAAQVSPLGAEDALPPEADSTPQSGSSQVAKPESPTGIDEVNNALGTALAPPMTSGERDAFRINVQQCWNVGDLSSQALRTTVMISFSLARDARPEVDTIRMIGFEGGDENAAGEVFNSARRAIARCGANGFDLPMDKYHQWREVELTFNPENMRIR